MYRFARRLGYAATFDIVTRRATDPGYYIGSGAPVPGAVPVLVAPAQIPIPPPPAPRSMPGNTVSPPTPVPVLPLPPPAPVPVLPLSPVRPEVAAYLPQGDPTLPAMVDGLPLPAPAAPMSTSPGLVLAALALAYLMFRRKVR